MNIEIREETIIKACDSAISYINDLMLFNDATSDTIRLEGRKNQRTPDDIAKDLELKRKEFYLIKSKASDGRSLTEDELRLIKEYL